MPDRVPDPPHTRGVLLRHDLPDGTFHFDLMIERRGGGRLLSFRVGGRIDGPEIREFRAERIDDHRPTYLDFEGPVSGGRGSVRRVATGPGGVTVETADRVAAELDWGHGRRVLEGTPE